MSKKEIQSIVEKLLEADSLYHAFGSSDMTDEEYDALKDRLRVLDPSNPIFKKVGHKETSKKTEKEHWKKVDHGSFKMGSQNKITTEEGLTKFLEKNKDSEYVIQHKMDGISIKMKYENGMLVEAATRGDGSIGEDITRNVKMMQGVPSKIISKDSIIVRGEIILEKHNLEQVGGKNARNVASGTAKRLDGENCNYLKVVTYNIMNALDVGFKTEKECIDFLHKNGFETVTTYFAKTVKEIEKIKKEYEVSKRNALDWDIDGLVIKTNTIKFDAWDYPERSVAYKFESLKAVTKLIDVIWQDSGGRINPVAILEPVDIGGATVSKASLNNIQFIKDLEIQIGDIVLVSRRNDVIPYIEGVSVSAGKHGRTIVAPTEDSEGYPIEFAKNAMGEQLVYLVSTNPNSKAKKIRQILAWYEAHDTKGVAEETVSLILENDIAKDLPSFFVLGLKGDPRLVELEGFGAGKFKILNKATKLTESTTLLKFLNGMDISGFSEKRFEAILEHFGKPCGLDGFVDMCINSYKDIAKIPGFGENTALSLHNLVNERKQLIETMAELVVHIEPWKPNAVNANTKINGLSFCFTGKMDRDRGYYEKLVKQNGGLIAGVSKTLDYLVTNDPNSGSSKNEKATKLGIKKINEKEFISLLGINI